MTEFRPEKSDIDKAREKVEEGVEKAEEILPKKSEVTVGFGWTESKFVKHKMNGSSGKAHSQDFFEVNFNSNVDGWKNSVLGTGVHEFAHSYHYEAIDFDHEEDQMKIWRYIIDEALTSNVTEKVAPEVSEPWRTKHSRNEIKKYWPKIKEEELERVYSFPDPLYINKSEEGYPNWLGYSLSYLIGRKLLELGHDLKDFPELEKEDVINAGNQIFGEN